jgi:site-specific DNA-methyltransferase (adenine-specific)
VKPYYSHGGVTIYHGDCREVLPHVRADVCITDPPYNDATHSGATTNGGGVARKLVTFPPISDADLLGAFAAISDAVRRWTIATVAWQHAILLSQNTPAGLRFVRLGAWVKHAPMPQLTGDRPAQGWEAVAILHRDGGKLRWNGGGKAAVFRHGSTNVKALWPTEKPLPLIREFLALFAEAGDLVVDPFCGSGTTLRAAKDAGYAVVGCDVSEAACEIAAKRCAQEVLFPAKEAT